MNIYSNYIEVFDQTEDYCWRMQILNIGILQQSVTMQILELNTVLKISNIQIYLDFQQNEYFLNITSFIFTCIIYRVYTSKVC
jgi:hypothetical protein